MQSQMQESQQPLMAGVVVSPAFPPPAIVQYQVPTTAGNRSTPRKYDNLKCKVMKVLGIIQILCGSIAIVINFVAPRVEASFWFVFVGVWCGPFFVLAGGFALGAVKHKTMCMIVACMVLSINATTAIVPILFVSGIGIANDADCSGDWFHSGSRCIGDTHPFGLTLNILLFIISVVEAVVSIWQSAVCCNTVCCLTSRQFYVMQTLAQLPTVQYAYSPLTGWQANIVTPSTTNMPVTYVMPAVGQPGVSGAVTYVPQQGLIVPGPSSAATDMTMYRPPEPPGYSGACAPPPYTVTEEAADTAELKKKPLV